MYWHEALRTPNRQQEQRVELGILGVSKNANGIWEQKKIAKHPWDKNFNFSKNYWEPAYKKVAMTT